MEKNSMTKNRGGNDGSEKLIEKTLRFLAGFKPTIPASERPQTNAFDRAATRTGRACDGHDAMAQYSD